jgi:uncharacterized membrane protein
MEANDPYKPPDAQVLKPLGSLSQAARANELKQAQRILIVVGVLTMALNGFLLYNLPNEIQKLIQQEQIAPADVEEFRQTAMIAGGLIYGAAALLGLLFVVFGVIIKQFPVPITVTSLVLYILAVVGFGILDPTTLASGFIIKIFIIFGLFRAIKAARAYQAHTQKPGVAEGLLE